MYTFMHTGIISCTNTEFVQVTVLQKSIGRFEVKFNLKTNISTAKDRQQTEMYKQKHSLQDR